MRKGLLAAIASMRISVNAITPDKIPGAPNVGMLFERGSRSEQPVTKFVASFHKRF